MESFQPQIIYKSISYNRLLIRRFSERCKVVIHWRERVQLIGWWKDELVEGRGGGRGGGRFGRRVQVTDVSLKLVLLPEVTSAVGAAAGQFSRM